MAKILETEADERRDDLQAGLAATSAISRIGTNVTVMNALVTALSFLSRYVIPENAKNLFGGNMRKNMATMTMVFSGMTLASLATATGGFLAKKKIIAELNRLGPEQVISPEAADDYIQTKSNHVERLVAQQTATQITDKTL